MFGNVFGSVQPRVGPMKPYGALRKWYRPASPLDVDFIDGASTLEKFDVVL